MVNSNLNPTAPIFIPKPSSNPRMLVYMDDEMLFTNKTLFQCILGKKHEYTPSQTAEIDSFIARGRADGFFHNVKPGVYRASWEHLILRAMKERKDLKQKSVEAARSLKTMRDLRSDEGRNVEEE